MPATAPQLAPHVYVDCDLPEGLTLSEWRRARRPQTERRSVLRRIARLP